MWRDSTRDEVFSYYLNEFPGLADHIPSFISATSMVEVGVAFDEPYPVRAEDSPPRDFIRRKTWETDHNNDRTEPFFESLAGNQSILDFLQQPAQKDPLQDTGSGLVDPDLIDQAGPLPFAVYYSVDQWDRSSLVVIDVDAKDIALDRARSQVQGGKDRAEILNKAGVQESAPEGYPYTFDDIDQALEYGFTIERILQNQFAAEHTMVVYSGQGCHVYLLDDDRAHQYDTKSRAVLADFLEEGFGIPIDRQVTTDQSRLIRLPYSLHSDVSRIVTPIDSPSFDYRTQARPAFLNEGDTA